MTIFQAISASVALNLIYLLALRIARPGSTSGTPVRKFGMNLIVSCAAAALIWYALQ